MAIVGHVYPKRINNHIGGGEAAARVYVEKIIHAFAASGVFVEEIVHTLSSPDFACLCGKPRIFV